VIEINNLTTNPVDKEFLEKVAKKVLIGENKEKLELSIVLVGQARIRKLNKKYRRKNRSTDVLSFTYDDSGEIVICLPEVKKNAKKFHSPLQKELAKVLIHGILHLLGYDHEKSEKAAKEMEEKQEHYLRKIYG